MMSNVGRASLAVFIAGVVGVGAAGLAVWKPWRHKVPNIATDGGTIIVCEVDQAGPVGPDLMRRMLEALERQNKYRHVTFRQAGDRRIEVLVPRLGPGDDEILPRP